MLCKNHLFAIISILGLLLLSACEKKDNTPDMAPETTNDAIAVDTSGATLLKQGSFSGSGGHSTKGTVKLYESEGKKYLSFENFSVTSGPDLKVYVATDNTASNFVSLGALKGLNGNQVYEVNNSTDLNAYNKVLIWCQAFSVLFGEASLR